MKALSLKDIPKMKTYSHTKDCPKISGKFWGYSSKNLSHSQKFACSYTYARGPFESRVLPHYCGYTCYIGDPLKAE